jgi:hypothetical protein
MMTIQNQVSARAAVYNFRAREYEVFAGWTLIGVVWQLLLLMEKD